MSAPTNAQAQPSDAPARDLQDAASDLPLSAAIADYIEGQILQGVFAPGEKLRQQHIGEVLGVSRTPVREALLYLQARGLVTMAPNRGAVVRRVTRRDAAESYLVRAELEGLASTLAAERVNPQELRELDETHAGLQRSSHVLLTEYDPDDERAAAAARQARLDWIEANDRFHDVVLRASRCLKLADTVKYVLSSLPRTLTWLAIEQNLFVLEHYNDEHQEIIDALRAHDPDRSRRAARDHVLHGRELMLTWLDSADDDLAR